MDPKTIKALADIGYDVTTATFSSFVDSLRIQLEAFDQQGYAPTPVYSFLGWLPPSNEDDGALHYRASTLIGSPQDAKYIGNYDVVPCGTYEAWKDMVIKDVIPYPTLQLVLIAALASVVIGILTYKTPIENPIVHLNLPSGKGKSTAGYLAASILGRPFDGSIPVKDEDGRTIERNSLYQSWGASQEDAGTWVSITLIFVASLLTGLGVFDDIAKRAGAGTLVPITGFSNSMVSPALEFKSEGFITGMAVKMFTIAGPVLVFGISASVIYGIILCILNLF